MKCRPENILLLFSALPGHNEYVIKRIDDILGAGIHWDFLLHGAESFGVATGLLELLSDKETPAAFYERLKATSVSEIKNAESMYELFLELSSLLSKHGFDYIPLKGCDPRIAHGSRRICNTMIDIDILVRESDTDNIGSVLEENGYIYHGDLSGSHMNFFTDDEQPRFIEIHRDLINRRHPVHNKLFTPVLAGIWERSVIVNGERLLSNEDLLSYITVHAVKEYFHKPKWLCDIAWVIENRSDCIDPGRMILVLEEWGAARALGFIAGGLDYCLHADYLEKVLAYGAVKPDIFGVYLARRLTCFNRLRKLRPLIFAASANSSRRVWGVMIGSIRRLAQKNII